MADHAYITNTLEKEQILNLLNSNRRLDGRKNNEFRDIIIETNVIEKANGSAIVTLGKTQVICGVKAVLGTPWPDTPNEGSFNFLFESSPMSAPEFRVGPPQDLAIEISRMTDRVIRESKCINLEELCLIPGKKNWTLNIDIYSLDDNGNFYDTCALAAYAALATSRLNDTKIDDEDNVEILETSKPLKLSSFPISVTTYKIGDHYVMDANLKEEQLSDARITIGTTDTHIVSGQKGGLVGMKPNEILDILTDTIRTAHEIREIVRKQVTVEQ
ncbi:MAG: exosome complex protein Rrp42 [Candidatus Kariarchaeaceae archaeon]|jgi:exosome complex component RRP42